MKSISVEDATRTARKKARDIRLVGEMPSYDMVVLEDRATGERRRVPMKYMFLANNKKEVAFEMVPAAEGSTAEDEE
jgi:hypothetical protein